ncbi:MAG: methyltransferase [Verrucomicrobiota bacterium]
MNPLDLRRAPQTDPTLIYRYRDGLHAVDLLITALVSFDLFTWIYRHPSSKSAICAEFKLAERPADVMLTLFTAMGFLENREGAFHVTALAREHLVSDSPWFLGPYYAALKDRPIAKDYLEILRTDRPASWGGIKNEKAWAEAMEKEPFATQFTSAMDCRGILLGPAAARAIDANGMSRMLDIAGGSGIYACSFVAVHPHLRATVFEKPPVDQIARCKITERGFDGRVEVVAGDMFCDALPVGHDLHLWSNVLHDWNETTVRELLTKSFRTLPPGGMVVIHDAHLNEDKSGPLHVAEYSALLMHTTEGKCYSVAEIRSCLEEIGFENVMFTPTAASRSIVTARRL